MDSILSMEKSIQRRKAHGDGKVQGQKYRFMISAALICAIYWHSRMNILSFCLRSGLLSFLPFSCYSVTRLLTTLAANIFRLLCLHFFNISRALHSFRKSIIPSANECVVYNNFIVPKKWNLELSSLQAYILCVWKRWESLLNYGKTLFGWSNFKAPSIFRKVYGIDAAWNHPFAIS